MGVAGGTALVLVQTALEGAAVWRIGRRLYPDDVGSALLAAVVLATAGTVAVLEVLGTVGWLTRWPVAVASVLVFALAWFATRRGPQPASLWREIRITPPRSAAEALARVAGVGLCALLLLVLADALLEPRYQFDALAYHLPIAVQWLQAGNIHSLPYLVPGGQSAWYPSNFELLETWLMLPVHRDFLVQVASVPGAVLAGGGTALLARNLGADRRSAAAFGLVALTLPGLLLTQIGTNLGDLFMAGAVTTAAAYLARYLRTDRRADGLIGAVALGLAVGSRYQGLLASVPIVLLVLAHEVKRRVPRTSGARVVTFAMAAAVPGAYFYVRNAVRTGNPFYPLSWSVPFHHFPAPADRGCCTGPSWLTLGLHPRIWSAAARQIVFGAPNLPQPSILGRSWGPMLPLLLVVGMFLPLVTKSRQPPSGAVDRSWSFYPAAQFVLYLATPLSAGYLGYFAAINVRYCLPAVLGAAALIGTRDWRMSSGSREIVLAIVLWASLVSTVVFIRGVAQAPLVPVVVMLVLGLPALVVALTGIPSTVSGLARRMSWSILAIPPVAFIGASPWLAGHYRARWSVLPYSDSTDHLGTARSVSLVGICFLYPFYGPDLDRRVFYLTGVDGRDPPLSAGFDAWVSDLRRHDVRTVVVGNLPTPCFPNGQPPQAQMILHHPGSFRLVYSGSSASLFSLR